MTDRICKNIKKIFIFFFIIFSVFLIIIAIMAYLAPPNQVWLSIRKPSQMLTLVVVFFIVGIKKLIRSNEKNKCYYTDQHLK